MVESLISDCMDCAVAGMPLPPTNGNIHVLWFDFHSETDAANPFGSNERAARAKKSIENNFAARRAVQKSVSDECYGFYCRMQSK